MQRFSWSEENLYSNLRELSLNPLRKGGDLYVLNSHVKSIVIDAKQFLTDFIIVNTYYKKIRELLQNAASPCSYSTFLFKYIYTKIYINLKRGD